MDENMEAFAERSNAVLGMRIFDAGPFHVGFGLVAFAYPDTIELAVTAADRGNRMPFRRSLARRRVPRR